MSELLKKIGQLTESGNPELAQSALRVVGALKLKDARILKGIQKQVESENPKIKLAAIEALGKIGSSQSVGSLFSIYKNDPGMRAQAAYALSEIGDPALPALIKEYKQPSREREYRKSIASVMARIGSKKSLGFLIEALSDPDIEMLKHICYEMRAKIEKMAAEEKTYLEKAVLAALNDAKGKKEAPSLVSLVIILGYFPDRKLKKVLMRFLDKKYPFVLRRNALLSIGRLGIAGKGNEDLAEALMPLLEENEFAGFHRTVIEILEKIEMSKGMVKEIVKHAESKSSELKKFALSKMGHLESKENVQYLMRHLSDSDPGMRQSAEHSLKKMPSAVPPLLQHLLKEEAGERLSRISAVLIAQKESITKLQLKNILDGMMAALAVSQDGKTQALFHAARQIDPDTTYKMVMKETLALKKKKKYQEETRLLDLISSSVLFTKEAKWELMAALLKLSNKDLSVVARNNDRALSLVLGWIKAQDKDVVKKLFREAMFTPEELYYIGFHFSEKLFTEKQFGVDVLKTLIKKMPRNQYSIQAKKRLQAVGTATAIMQQ
ncbi:MAG: HEAT repeat domain-containing protein [Candidatus Omnitrophica bacterium]|nr:HEAT repeat domain-containing protein [Candidatus Omnitrophota bacterium]